MDSYISNLLNQTEMKYEDSKEKNDIDEYLDNHEEEEENKEMNDLETKTIKEPIQELPEQKEVDEKVEHLVKTLVNQAENSLISKEIELDYIKNNTNFFSSYFDYKLPDYMMFTDKIINKWTNYNYNPFGGVRQNMFHSMQARLAFLIEAGKILNYDFIGKVDHRYRFDNLDEKIANYIFLNSVPCTVLEYKLLKSMLGKLLICLNSDVERSFCNNNITTTTVYRKVLFETCKVMRNATMQEKKIDKSWNIFIDTYMNSSADKQIYIFKNPAELGEKMKQCYDNDFLMETMLANTLKTYFPTISFDYITVIKNIYLLLRLVSIYISKELYKNKTKDRVMIDLSTLAHMCSIEYETLYFANSMVPRSLPSSNNPNIKEETNMYYANHTLVGPQYFVLKQMELSIPVIVQMLNIKE